MAALLHLITLFSLSAIILSVAENISIDCGSTGSYVDSNNVRWVGDTGFVTTGETMKIPDVVTKPINTLRYFPTGQTNCYTNIPVIKHRKTQVRTKFYYDGKYSPPSFDVIYDNKHRDLVEITDSVVNDEENFYSSEVIFAPANENISVYPSDPYGRLWSPIVPELKLALITSAPSVDITGASNKPPESVMSKAMLNILVLYDLAFPLTGIPVYLALYFSEPLSLHRTQKRSFNVFLDDMQVGSDPIVPVFGKATQVVLRDVGATPESNIVFQSTDDSDLPPIINGLEIYSISNSQFGIAKPRANNAVRDEAKATGGKKKKIKLPLILGVTFASAFAILSSAFGAIFIRKSGNAKPRSNTAPTTSTGHETGTGMSPLVGQQSASDTNVENV
ncbi:unnamed protein product [Thlaspi arvense]|uniref:Malectin-like domain-containing protein n=1 Tax=Thlaspi arvense TaxID=13288 RepID=A0AAU9SFP4_THLAR|nr:unnamed protein product [Thlaspi arvense]